MTYSDGTGGYEAGSDTSQERAEKEASDGTLSKRLSQVLGRISMSGTHGATWFEVAQSLDLHHGSASSALTNLHRQGLIARTKRTRGRSKVYVTPSNALNDTLEPYIPRANKGQAEIVMLRDRIDRGFMALMAGNTGEAMKILSEES